MNALHTYIYIYKYIYIYTYIYIYVPIICKFPLRNRSLPIEEYLDILNWEILKNQPTPSFAVYFTMYDCSADFYKFLPCIPHSHIIGSWVFPTAQYKFMSRYICMYICIYVYTWIYLYTYIYVCMCTYLNLVPDD